MQKPLKTKTNYGCTFLPGGNEQSISGDPALLQGAPAAIYDEKQQLAEHWSQ